jgi:hypothetical protein
MASRTNDYPPYGAEYGSRYGENQQSYDSHPYSSYPESASQATTTHEPYGSSYDQHGEQSEDSFSKHPSRTSYQQSPFKTPFDDENAYSSRNPSSYTLNRPSSHDPFADNSAIPLQMRSHPEGDYPPTPPIKDQDQQYGTYPPTYPPQTERMPPPEGLRRWFTGPKRIPIACYVLSLVQLIVFIYEIVRNGSSV